MDLDKLIKEQKDTLKENFPIYRVKKISKQILSGVEFLHQHRICHRDLKPQNVLLRDGVFRDILSIKRKQFSMLDYLGSKIFFLPGFPF